MMIFPTPEDYIFCPKAYDKKKGAFKFSGKRLSQSCSVAGKNGIGKNYSKLFSSTDKGTA